MSVDEQRRPARVKRLPREVRERQILDAAVRVFSAHGYHNASMDEISEVAPRLGRRRTDPRAPVVS